MVWAEEHRIQPISSAPGRHLTFGSNAKFANTELA